MITVKNSSDLPEYTSEHTPIIHLTHGLQRSEIVAILAIAYKKYGLELFDELGIPRRHPSSSGKVFYNFVAGGDPPYHVHNSEALAFQEAERLCNKTGKEVRVLLKVGIVKPVCVKTEAKIERY